MARAPASTREQRQERLLTVSNRGPVEHHYDESGEVIGVPGQGGLANALRVAAQFRPTTWLSSPMTPVDRAIAQSRCKRPPNDGASHFVLTDSKAYDLFYGTFSNEALWFLQHSLQWPGTLEPETIRAAWEQGYLPVNRAFADAIVEELDDDGIRAVMLHDYHFYAAPRMVREARPNAYLQHFIHIPWPRSVEWKRLDPDVLATICDGLLGNDSLVFQTAQSAQNFLETCSMVFPDVEVDSSTGAVSRGCQTTRVWANGISVDPDELTEASTTPEFSQYRWLLRPPPGQKTIVRVDRLDVTKNVVGGFEAYRLLLQRHPELRERVSFLSILVPSKSDIPAYREYQEQTHAIVAEINKEFGNHHWRPIRLLFEHNRMQALAAMSLYDVLLVNPLADGMNLVAKEGPLLNTRDGVLVLSKKAGAYEELASGSLGIEPCDISGTADAIYLALSLPPDRRRELALRLRGAIRCNDLRAWFSTLMDDIERNAPVPASSAA